MQGGGLADKCLMVLPQLTRLADTLFTFYDPQTSDLLSTYLLILFRGGNGMTNFGYDTERPNNPAEVVWSMFTIIFQLFLAAYVLGAFPSPALKWRPKVQEGGAYVMHVYFHAQARCSTTW